MPAACCRDGFFPGFAARWVASDATKRRESRFSGMIESYVPRNRLLLALPARAFKRILPDLEYVRCESEKVLIDADSSLDRVFFPDSGVISVVAVYADGSIIEMATIGREGCTGAQAAFGVKSSSVRLLVQVPGNAVALSRVAFTKAMNGV